MNNILPTPINEKRVKKTLVITLLLFCLLPVVLNVACLTPIIIRLSSDVAFENSPIILTLKYILDLFSVISFVSVYAVIEFSQVLLKKKITIAVSVLCGVFILVKIFGNILAAMPIYSEAELVEYFFSLFEASLFEGLQLALVLIFSTIIAKSYLRSVNMIESKKQIRKSIRPLEHILPIKKLFNWYNPLLRSAFYSSIIITAIRVLARTISIIISSANIGSANNIFLIITDYASDFIFGFAAYMIFIFIFNFLFEMMTKATKKCKDSKDKNDKKENKADENNSSALFED